MPYHIGQMRKKLETASSELNSLEALVDREVDRRNALRDEVNDLISEQDEDLSGMRLEVLNICHDLGIQNMVNPIKPSASQILDVIRHLSSQVK
jgi:hypothetical protein